MNRYIAIEFEVGSGGLEIARRVAGELSLPCYGREVLRMVAEEQNLTRYEIRSYVESITDSFLFSYYIMNQVRNNQVAGLPQEGLIYAEQRKKLKKLAENGSSVFAGQCAVEVIKNLGSVTRVFIKGDYESRQKYIINKMTDPSRSADSFIKRLDCLQERYYFCNENKRWCDPNNYDIVLDSSQIGIEKCVEAIMTEYMRASS